MNNHEFDDIIKESAQQREAAVPPEIWEGISKRKRKRRYPFFWIILLGMLLAGSVLVWSINNKELLPDNLAMNQKEEGKKNPTLKTQADKRKDISIDTSNENAITPPAARNETIAVTKESNIDTETIAGKQNKNNLSTASAPSNYKATVNKPDLDKQKIQHADEGNAFASTDKKTTSGARAGINIIPADTENNNTELLKEKAIIPATEQDKKGTEIANDEIAPDVKKKTAQDFGINDKIGEDGKTVQQQQQINTRDSLTGLKIETSLKDSSSDNKKIVAQKDDQKNKRHTSVLKIETGCSVIFPVQHYEEPVAVKRFTSDANTNSDFISNSIQTTVETGFTISIAIVKKLAKKWDIGAGLYYTRFTEKLHFTGEETITKFSVIQTLVNNGNNSFLKTDTISALSKAYTTLNARNIYNNFGISPFARYNVIKRNKFSLAITAGMYVDLLRRYNNKLPGEFEVHYNDGRVEKESKKAIGIGFSGGLHFSGALSKSYEWFAGASSRYDVSGYNSNVLSFNKEIHMPAITFGIAYKLKK